MKREGTGRPRAPDISFEADVRTRELRFEKVPNPEVRFTGNTRRNSVWASRRENLPQSAQEGVVYRDAGVRVRIATEVAEDLDERTTPRRLGQENYTRKHTNTEEQK